MLLAVLAAWTMHVIAPANTTWKGADGVAVADIDEDGDVDVMTPWEQGDRVSIALNPGDPKATWQIVPLVGVGTVEDVAIGDIDRDGCLDIVAAAESKHMWIAFQDCTGLRPHPTEPWTRIDLPGASSQRWLKVSLADLDGNGALEVIGGGKHTSAGAGTIEVWSVSQGGRSASDWTRKTVAPIGWCMTLHPTDVDGDSDLDLLVSDRKGAALASSQKGTWWFEQDGQGWTPHHVAHIPGDAGDLGVLEFDHEPVAIVDGNRTDLWWRRPWGDDLGWLTKTLPFPVDVGDFHAAVIADMNGDGLQDVVLTFALTDASGVVYLQAPDWRRVEVSGVIGHKYDNIVAVDIDRDGDLDLVTSEGGDINKTDDLGVDWFENPGP